MPAFTRQHPRYTISLLCILFITTLYFASNHYTPLPPPVDVKDQYKNLDRLQSFSGKSLEKEIAVSEAYYQEHLKNRQKLITKFGPTVGEVEAFPYTHSHFYTLWDFFIPAFQCPHRVHRVGTLGDGGKWVCGLERIAKKKDCVIYSIGINGESSFEAELLERAPGCQVWGYDFSVDKFGPEIELEPSIKSRAHFQPYKLAGKNAHGPNDKEKAYTLSSLMSINGHKWIDILKVDIEGFEFETLEALVKAFPEALPFGQLQLEIHVWSNDKDAFPKFLKWWEMLERAGLRPFWTEPNLVYVNVVNGAKPTLAEYSFINLKGDHDLITDKVE